MNDGLRERRVKELEALHPEIRHLLNRADPLAEKLELPFGRWLESLDPGRLSEAGLDAEQLRARVEAILSQAQASRPDAHAALSSLTLKGGVDKAGKREALDLEIKVGEVICIVGPTGSGKSRLLGDIESLAQGDSPSGRTVLVNGAPPDPSTRFGSNRRLVAQLSQNMNFVVDLSVLEFLTMHAACRSVGSPASVVAEVIACANELAGERFAPETAVTQLSGGQSRALMIADTALLSASPIVLIDEIENAGIDRSRALQLLIAREKIVLISTHDPILALMGNKRIVVGNGSVVDIIETSYLERWRLQELQRLDACIMDVRRRLREGKRIEDVDSSWGPPF
ncbi:ATP-binding cassette domain-containing protein [Methylocystis heyeri]|uniref:ATP-binding cassette domain-containing protein n=1 Tax=Methylocystis heyeri TaxID=391905 RepID=A0A6B8KJT5_9HYPH|nr:ATP-binding cassette domain-containing protein [Methylocystis heyeri]QGM46868.1 ATP-binding cassette domain-containing protein [Methylocystis heyeri]